MDKYNPIPMRRFYTLFFEYATAVWTDNHIPPEIFRQMIEIYEAERASVLQGKFNVNLVFKILENKLDDNLGKEVLRNVENAIIDQFNGAGIYGLFKGLKELGIEEQYDYWFSVDQEDMTERNCEICYKIVSNNPYSYKDAVRIFLPHRGCWSTWTASPKE